MPTMPTMPSPPGLPDPHPDTGTGVGVRPGSRSDAEPDGEVGPGSGGEVGWGSRWQAAVEHAWGQVAAERGIDFDPPPDVVAAALPSLAGTVERLAAGMGERDRRWLAAALAALADHVQRTTLPDPPSRPDVRTRKSCERAWQIAGVDSSRADAGDCPEWGQPGARGGFAQARRSPGPAFQGRNRSSAGPVRGFPPLRPHSSR